jgi:hypothetical protein
MFLRGNRVYRALPRFKTNYAGSLRKNSTSVSPLPKNDAAVKPRTIFSGIQPTGIPHVRLLFPGTRFSQAEDSWATI